MNTELAERVYRVLSQYKALLIALDGTPVRPENYLATLDELEKLLDEVSYLEAL